MMNECIRSTDSYATTQAANIQGCSGSEEQSGFEISDKNYNKWIRDEYVKEHGHISVKNDSNKNHSWKMDRTSSQMKPSWTFASPSADGQLYVTYNMNENGNEVTMEYPMKKQGEKGINFTMLLQAGGRMLFRAESSPNRYLVQNQDGQLGMKTIDDPTDEMEWMISFTTHPLDTLSTPSRYSAQIKNGTQSKKWKSSGSAENHPVQQIQTSSPENWTITLGTGNILKFSSGSWYINKYLLFGNSSSATNFQYTKAGPGVTLLCNDNKEYIYGPEDDGDLEWKISVSEATVWELLINM